MNPILLIISGIACAMLTIAETKKLRVGPRGVIVLLGAVTPPAFIWACYELVNTYLGFLSNNQQSLFTGITGVLSGILLIVSLEKLGRSRLSERLARSR